MKTIVKRLGIVCAVVVGIFVVVVGGYAIYLTAQYYRIADNTSLEIANQQKPDALLHVNTSYTALTYNIGFGAYLPEYSFFMDTGVMNDGREVQGQHAIAQSAESVEYSTQGVIDTISELDPDFCLLQEVDTDSTRSWGVNQSSLIMEAFPHYAMTFASAFHTAYLAYPLHEPHGIANSGLQTESRFYISEALRRSYPVDESWPTKFFDLDRCFSMQRVPVDNGKELVLINSHMSAYDEGGVIRALQSDMLNGVLEFEAARGNYVICGGDFNHAFPGTVGIFPCQQQLPEWLQVFDEEQLARGVYLVHAENEQMVATCRSADIPYEKGVNYEAVIDGFIVSDNVRAQATHLDTAYAYSDHNPVLLSFELLP